MMKKLAIAGRSTTTASVSLLVLTTLAGAFWLATSPAGLAQGDGCSVCHKRTQTISFPCNSLEYRRHLDHGDPMGPCAVTPVTNP